MDGRRQLHGELNWLVVLDGSESRPPSVGLPATAEDRRSCRNQRQELLKSLLTRMAKARFALPCPSNFILRMHA